MCNRVSKKLHALVRNSEIMSVRRRLVCQDCMTSFTELFEKNNLTVIDKRIIQLFKVTNGFLARFMEEISLENAQLYIT